ncbi:hypothetical protein [Mycolicibacterium fortuitum]|uniref:hypothetical protein n=1 Tax=Mycolicibacterium fortuitum TaxID=1766 RepID=UPI003AACBC9B
MTVTPPALLDPAHVARIELAYAAHLRALHSAFGITPTVVDYDYDRDYVSPLPGPPRDLQLRASLEGGLVVEAHEGVPGRGSGLFCPCGSEPGEWRITIARYEAVDQRAPFEYGHPSRPPRIEIGLSEIAWARSVDRSPRSLAQAVGNALHSAVGRSA